MKKSTLKIQGALILSALGLFSLTTDAVGQGSLIPPGPPEQTMKTLDQVHPGTPISTIPFTIWTPGAYYFATNVTGLAGLDGITIDCNDVTLDLNGFSLIGVPTSMSGIVIYGARVTIRNGVIRNWGTNGINALYGNALSFNYNNLMVVSNGYHGLDAGVHALVEDCVAEYNGGNGIQAGPGSIVRNCLAHRNGQTGISGYTTGTYGKGVTIIGCTASQNSTGILPSPNGLVQDNSAVHNINSGIGMVGSGARVENNLLNYNAVGVSLNNYTNLVIRNSFSGNTNAAISGNASYMPTGPFINAAGVWTNLNPNANIAY